MEAEEIELHGFRTCEKGHRSSLLLPTPSGGTICLVCFSNLVSDPSSPSHHVSYAISQLSQAMDGLRGVEFRRKLIQCHVHLLVMPLVQAMCLFEDEAVGRQVVDLVSDLCCGRGSEEGCGGFVRDFVVRIGDRVASGVLGWSSRQINTLHCLGILLDRFHLSGELRTGIRDTTALVSSLLLGVQLPSEEIRGEIFFVLYKLCLLQDMPWDDGNYMGDDDFWAKLLLMSLEALLKIQRDDVRLNCIAFLTVLILKGRPVNSYPSRGSGGTLEEKDNLLQTEPAQMANLFADAIKGPLLSSDTHVQIATLDLVFHFLSSEDSIQLSHVFVEEGVADYVFEILRLSGKNDLLIISSLRLLDLLAIAEEFLRQRLAVGLPVLLSTVQYVAETPLHPVQTHALRLVKRCMLNSPGALSRSQLEELALVLTEILRRHTSVELGMPPETFILVCSIFVEVMKSPSSRELPKVNAMLQEASKSVILSSLSLSRNSNGVILHALYLLKEAYCYVYEDISVLEIQRNELDSTILDICEDHLLPWLRSVSCEDKVEDEDNVLGVLEMFHFILIQGPHIQSTKFAKVLASSSWFNLSFGLLGLFVSERMKWRIYLMLSSIIDCVLGEELGEPIRDAYQLLPFDPLDLIFLLGQKNTLDVTFLSAQSAVISILYCSSLYDERLADDSHVLASLEQYILLNGSNFSREILGSFILTQLLHLYSFLRGAQANRGITLYSLEAEKILFRLITENDWDLLHMCIHPTALKWLFKQDRLIKPLSDQILRFCRYYNKSDSQLSGHANRINALSVETIADLLLCGDSHVASLLILLISHRHEESKDVVSVLNVIQAILDISPEVSNELCLHGFDSAICGLYSSNFAEHIFSRCSILIFSVLQSVSSEILSRSGSSWLLLTLKLLESLVPKSADEVFSKEACQVIGILSLILNHSAHHALVDASKAILLNSSLISAVHAIIQAYCTKGPVSIDYIEGTATEVLTLVVLLYFFSLKSLYALLQESLDWEDFLYSTDGNQRSPVICIRFHDLCRLIHFGCSSVKLVASQCLVELLMRISYRRDKTQNELRCSARHLQSLIAVTEGLIFYEDSMVATNCGQCLSMILGWGKLGTDEKTTIKVSKWCRFIAEELALSLAMSSSTSKSFTIHQKPAIYVTIAYLRLHQTPGWMKSVFNTSSISSIINKLSACHLRAEMVELFRELYAKEYLNKEHVESLKNVFQACKKHFYGDRAKNCPSEDNREKISISSDETGNTCKVLLHLMLSSNTFCNGIQTKEKKLLEEIELFLQLLRE